MPVTIEHDRHRRVSCERCHLLRVSAVGDPQRYGRVAEIVHAQRFEAGLADGRVPEPPAEKRRPDRLALG